MNPQTTLAWLTVGRTTYPNNREDLPSALTRLAADITGATGVPVGQGQLPRLRQMITARFPSGSASYAALAKTLAEHVVQLDAASAVEYLAATPAYRRGAIVFRSNPDMTALQGELAAYPGVLAVLSGVNFGDIVAAGLMDRVIVLAKGARFQDVCLGLITRLSGMRLNVVNTATTPALYQQPQERGDMHDVRPLLAINPKMPVTVCVPRFDTWGDAAEILNYYLDYAGRVSVYLGQPPERDLRKGILRATDATRLLLDAALDGMPIQPLSAATAGPAKFSPEEARAYATDLMAHGWKGPDASPRLLIVNFRDSGHVDSLLRGRSHPELDTGTTGFVQLLNLAKKMGFIPVPMGHRGDLVPSDMTGPHLLEYWKWNSCRPSQGSPRRLAEYRLLHYIATQFRGKVFALAMRSGSTDALCYCGIPTISIDLALEGCTRDEALTNCLVATDSQKPDELVFPYGHPGSWRRAMKRILIVPKVFHQVYLTKVRADRLPADPNWTGAIHDDDLGAIEKAVAVYFDTGDHTAAPPNSPLAAEGFAKNLLLFHDPEYAKALAPTTSEDGWSTIETKRDKRERREANRAVAEAQEDLELLRRLLQKSAGVLK